MDEKPRRWRWFRFSLSTFLLVVTAICLWFGWQYRIVYERREAIRLLQDNRVDYREGSTRNLNWFRQALGDKRMTMIALPIDMDEDEQQRIKRAFPEAMKVFNKTRQ